ncbi:MAG: PIG-L family deacetylase, partial [Acidobacteriota bacterium]
SWMGRYLPGVPADDEGRRVFIREWLVNLDAEVANNYRDLLIKRYGEQGSRTRYAEAFEVCEYGAPADWETLNQLFPR